MKQLSGLAFLIFIIVTLSGGSFQKLSNTLDSMSAKTRLFIDEVKTEIDVQTNSKTTEKE